MDHADTPRFANAGEAAEVGRLLHDFNTEFETPSPGAEVLSEHKHGANDDDILHADRNPVRVFEQDDLVMLI